MLHFTALYGPVRRVTRPLQVGGSARILTAGPTGEQRVADHSTQRNALYASAGRRLIHYELDVEHAALTERATILLPGEVQYAWPHASGRWLYVASSDGSPLSAGTRHWVSALAIDPATGALSAHGEPVPLRWRPLHITTDARSSHLLIAYNRPSATSVHRIAPDGAIGTEVAQNDALDFGIFAHQARVAPSNAVALVVTRGNDAEPGKPEDPGAIKVFDYRDGRLSNTASIAPGGGYGYGPRHLDFHPTRPWVFVAIERQNLLHVHDFANDVLGAAPLYSVGTLADVRHHGPEQRAGALHVHPNGRFVYVSNRARASKDVGGQRVFAGGENTIAVYAVNPDSGEPTLVQHVDSHGIAPRTFAIDPSGRLLVAANLMPLPVAEADGVRVVPAGLAVYRIGADGTLDFVRKYDLDPGEGQLFWMGMVGLQGTVDAQRPSMRER
jgi:6-phosphogluconolactonase